MLIRHALDDLIRPVIECQRREGAGGNSMNGNPGGGETVPFTCTARHTRIGKQMTGQCQHESGYLQLQILSTFPAVRATLLFPPRLDDKHRRRAPAGGDTRVGDVIGFSSFLAVDRFPTVANSSLPSLLLSYYYTSSTARIIRESDGNEKVVPNCYSLVDEYLRPTIDPVPGNEH